MFLEELIVSLLSTFRVVVLHRSELFCVYKQHIPRTSLATAATRTSASEFTSTHYMASSYAILRTPAFFIMFTASVGHCGAPATDFTSTLAAATTGASEEPFTVE